jgi:hypothetical protein
LIIQLLRKHMVHKGHSWVEVTSEAQHTLTQELHSRLQNTVWLRGGCKSWYLTPVTQNSSSSSSGGGGGGGGRQGGNAVESEGWVVRPEAAAAKADAPAGDKLDAGSSGGAVFSLWPGLCTEFWWRTLWPVEKDWQSGQAANPPTAAGAKQHKPHSA